MISNNKTSQHAAMNDDPETGSPAVLSDPEAHTFLRMRPGTLARMRCERRGPAWSYVGRRVVYLRADLMAFLAANRVAPSGQS